jgi:hypothetical protein
MNRGDGEEEEGVDAAAALPNTPAPVRVLSAYCCGGERSVYCFGGAEESKGGDWGRGCYVGARGEGRPRRGGRGRRRGCCDAARGGARESAKRGDEGALRRVVRLQRIVLQREAAPVS